MHVPTWAPGFATRLFELFFPKRPHLTVEIRQVCFDDVLESVTEDWSSYTIELYLFLDLWVVNKKEVPAAIKDWKLTLRGDGKSIQASRVEDISKWRQHIKLKKRETSLGFERCFTQDILNNLKQFPAQPLTHGIPSEGWVCFVASGVTEAVKKSASVELFVVDSFDKTYKFESHGPWPCKGNMYNPDIPF